MKKNFLDKYLTPIAILLAGIIVALALAFGHGGSAGTAGTQQAAAPSVDVKNIKTDGDPYIGDPKAPNTMVLFYDYQCPFCKQFELGVSPKLVQNYVNTGKLRIVFKDFQFLGNDSISGAVFGRALWESQPDKFYPWFIAMFNAQDQEGDQGFGNLPSIEKLAATIPGLDVAKVEALIAQKRSTYEQAAAQDRAEGAAVGVNGTPTIIVGNQLLTGMSPDQFYSAISAAIEKGGK